MRPELLLTLVGLVVLALAVALPAERRHWAAGVALVGVVAAGALAVAYLPGVPIDGPKIVSGEAIGGFHDGAGRPAFLADGFSVVFKIVFLIGAGLCILMSVRYLDHEGAQCGEFYAVVLFAVVGMMFLASGNDFATIYIGLETMALSSYVLVGFSKGSRKSNEAALKYFILGALASGILLYGFSLVYGATGSFNLDGISESIASGAAQPAAMLNIGAVLVLVGMGFKIAAVPFHMWAPDAYEGAPTPVTAFISTAAKAAAFAMLLRVFLRGFYGLADSWTPLLVVLSVASMTLGNVVAIVQDNVKRMLAYSSIAHVGYALMGLIAVGAAGGDAVTERYGLTAVVLYLLIYTFTNMGAFGLVVLLRRGDVVGDRVEDFRGLSRRNPLAAAAMVVFLLSLAGIPCTAGFIGKWWLFGAAIKAHYVWLAVVAVLNTVVSLYYYARLVVAMYMEPAADTTPVPISAGMAFALTVTLFFTLAIGLYPEPFIRLAQMARIPLQGG
jgi:NADH-quinone oxidoreductase subunit N